MEDARSLWQLAQGTPGLGGGAFRQGSCADSCLDLGFVPGAQVECLGRSPLGDPAAYRVRGAVVALRRRDAQLIALGRGEE